jgi:hypothetical protein
MKIYAICQSDDSAKGAGPFTDKKVADIALKLMQMIDPDSEMIECEVNEWAEELKAGLRPWKISVDLNGGRVVGQPIFELCWPPMPEGIISETTWSKQYFVWALTQNEAIRKLPYLKKNEKLDQSDYESAEAGG